MKPILIFSDKFLNSISWFMRVGGISIFPFVVVREKYRDREFWKKKLQFIYNHESIHFHQTLELGIVFFYVFYCLEFLIKLPFYGKKTYVNLSFEREAYQNELNTLYLKSRKPYSWIKLIW